MRARAQHGEVADGSPGIDVGRGLKRITGDIIATGNIEIARH